MSWPLFPGSSSLGFAGKYSLRQLDSIVAQILSIGSKGISSDYPYISGNDEERGEKMGHRYMVVPYLFPGWLSGRWVIGIGRSPKVTQLHMRVQGQPSIGTWDAANPTNYQPPKAMFDLWLEWWLPAGYFGGPKRIDFQASRYFVGHRAAKSTLNVIDFPRWDGGTNNFAAPLPRDPAIPSYSYWANQLLTNNQGIDMAGNPGDVGTNTILDKDQVLAAAHHDPYSRINPASPGPWQYKGTAGPNGLDSGTYRDYASPFFMTYIEPDDAPAEEWQPGEMRSIRSMLGLSYRIPMQTNAANLEIGGGIAVKTQMKDGHLTDPDPVPLEAARGAYIKDGITTQEPFQGHEGPADPESDATMNTHWASSTLLMPNGNTIEAFPGDASKNLRDRVLASVIPVTVSIPGLPGAAEFTARVQDPLVNKFPGDWEAVVSTTIQPSPDVATPWDYPDTALRSSLVDPDSYWMPQADAGLSRSIAQVAEQTLIPRSARMPNIGYLQYVRTGIIPDDESVDYSQQRGTPFRLLSFAPSYELRNPGNALVGQQTTNSASQSYPDWALLDLFYIPSTLAPYGSTYNPAVATPTTNAVETRLLYYGTYGGATAGKINPNGVVIYTTNVNVAETNIFRRLPVEAVLNGVMINQNVTGSGTSVGFTNGTSVSATNIAAAIESYLRTNGPLRMPAEICNVPAIASLRATNNPTRNDLVRQVVGALTTQGNVFSVWTVGQAIQKKPVNTGYDEFENGDNILAEVRLHFIVERYLDPGADNVYGNAASAGPDVVIGTYDDPVDSSTHPSQPRYLYRVLASEEIR